MGQYHIYPVLKAGRYFYQWERNIGIYPTPTEIKVVRIHYVREPKTLTQGSTPTAASYAATPEIPTADHDALVAFATYKILLRLDPQKAMAWKAEWIELFDKAVGSSKIVKDEIVYSPYNNI